MEGFLIVVSLLIFCSVTVRAATVTASVGNTIVTTSVGDIVGFSDSWENVTVNKYLGVPFAEVPTGDLRFEAPVAKAHFTAPFSANAFGPRCIQPFNPVDNQTMSEDCLRLNLYVPTSGEANKAVMVWIHGGGFVLGHGDLYDGLKMAALGDVIIVTLNYRLGIFGFFTTGDANASGNYGLLDQQLALKWVKNNIGAFGGDQNRVTIFGESAGAASGTWQMLAPSNKGMFQRIIAESGVASSPWGFPNPKTTTGYSNNLARVLGCANADSSEVVACLRKLPEQAFGVESSSDGFPHSISGLEVPVGPRVDGTFITTSPNCLDPGQRIEDHPLFKSVDFLVGANKYEGSPFLANTNLAILAENKSSLYDGVSEADFKMIATSFAGLDDDKAVDTLWKRYAKGQTQMTDARDFLEFLGDALFYKMIIRFLDSHVVDSTGSTYFYSFLPMPSKEVGSIAYGAVPPVSPYVDGSIHTDELGYIFGNTTMWKSGGGAPGEKELSDAMITYWTNFAKSGNPNKPAAVSHKWPEYNSSEKKFIEFDIQNKKLDLRNRSSYRSQFLSYWNGIEPRMQYLCATDASQSIRPCGLSNLIKFVLSLISGVEQ
ncbi:acetylcholinesterase-like [Lineus longissimus]|uniref:acetylcholinesterase-like n=1 Tax=Lineus longissimus TaxID=88925 RepID=UPI002B4DEAFE